MKTTTITHTYVCSPRLSSKSKRRLWARIERLEGKPEVDVQVHTWEAQFPVKTIATREDIEAMLDLFQEVLADWPNAPC